MISLVFLAALAALSGCGGADAETEDVTDLKARGDELVDRTVQITAQVEFVAGELDRFRIKDPDKPSEEGLLVRCTPEQFESVKKELDRLESDRLTLVGLVYRTAPPDSKLSLEFRTIAGSRAKWLILAGLAVVAAGIAVVVVLLLRKPERSVEDLIYAQESEDTIRRYGQLAIHEGGRLTRMWFLSYDPNLSEARITSSDIVLGSRDLLIGRDNPVLGVASMTVSRRVAALHFETASRHFVLTNAHERKPMRVAEGSPDAEPRAIEPGRRIELESSLWLFVDDHVRVHLMRRADEGEPGAPLA